MSVKKNRPSARYLRLPLKFHCSILIGCKWTALTHHILNVPKIDQIIADRVFIISRPAHHAPNSLHQNSEGNAATVT